MNEFEINEEKRAQGQTGKESQPAEGEQGLREHSTEHGASSQGAIGRLRSTQRKGRVVGVDKAALIAPPVVPRPKRFQLCFVVGHGLWRRVLTITDGMR